MIYDFDITQFRPPDTTATAAGANFLNLYQGSLGFMNSVVQVDRDCLHIWTPGMNVPAQTIRLSDAFNLMLAPAQTAGVSDYIVTGSITGANGAYVMSVSLQDATTREQVAESTASFAQAVDALIAGGVAAASMGSPAARIRSFQVNKRDASGSQTAISAHYKLKADKPLIEVSQTSGVVLELTDCDGAPLRNREVTLSVQGPGSLTPGTVTTDGEGVARTEFHADQGKGMAHIYAAYPYTTVTHHHAHAVGSSCDIQVDDPIAGYQLQLRATKEIESVLAQSQDTLQFSGDYNRIRHVMRSEEHFSLSSTVWFDASWTDQTLYSNTVLDQSESGNYTFTARDSLLTEDGGAKSYTLASTSRDGKLDHTNPGQYTVEIHDVKIGLWFNANYQAEILISTMATRSPGSENASSFTLPPVGYVLGFDPILTGGYDTVSTNSLHSDVFPFNYSTNSITGDGEATPKVTVQWHVRGMLRPIKRTAAPTELPASISASGDQVSLDYRGGPGAELQSVSSLPASGSGTANTVGPHPRILSPATWTVIGDAENLDHFAASATNRMQFYRLILR